MLRWRSGWPGLSAYTTLTATTPIVVAGGPTSIAGPRWIVAAAQVVAALALDPAPASALGDAGDRRRGAGGADAGLRWIRRAGLVHGARRRAVQRRRHCERRQAVIALAALTAYWVLLVVRDPLNEDIRDMLGSWPVYLVYVLVWLLGVYLRTRRLYVAQLRDRAERAEAEREERARAGGDERARIARELHDAVAHAISVMVVQAEAAEEMLAHGPRSGRACRSSASSGSGREGLAEMRQLLGVLRHDESAALAPQPGLRRTRRPRRRRPRRRAFRWTCTIEGEPRPLPAGSTSRPTASCRRR